MKHPLKPAVIVLLILFFSFSSEAQDTKNETAEDNSNTKEGWKTGIPIPTISFDQDLGFQYGIGLDLFDFGKPGIYPAYKHKFYFEWSRTTKGSGINRIYYDSEYLIPKVRLTADMSYLTEQALQFFGFNGYDAVYNAEWEDDSNEGEYKSRAFYRHDRKIFRVLANFQGHLLRNNKSWYWIAGFTFFNTKVGSVDIDRLNKGKDDDKKLPEVDGLYDKYVAWDIIKPEEKDGNVTTYLKAGLLYDSRDFQFFPSKGIWSEATFSYAPGFLGDENFTYSKFTIIHRHYVPLGSKDLVFAYRLGYQTTLSGDVPFHIQPHIVPTFMTAATSQGLGGAKTLRGVMRNRVVGDGIVLGNVELRWKFLKTKLGKSDLYLGTNVFFDAGRVVDEIDVDYESVKNDESFINGDDDFDDYFAPGSESFHPATGLGLKIGYNENQIISVDYGFALDKRDGKSGLYIRFYWLF
jgi:outer membrane protein assembly factor BamA